jgi:hypothetical protein
MGRPDASRDVEDAEYLKAGHGGRGEFRHHFAELLGTFALTFVAAGGGVIAAVNKTGPSSTAQVVALALVVLAIGLTHFGNGPYNRARIGAIEGPPHLSSAQAGAGAC